MLQNRVDPAGNIILTPARGRWMGNRGIIHNNRKEIIRRSATKAWITCSLEYKGRRLPVMESKHNTQLFFLDEATAFSAGHRPCAQCRRSDYNRFKVFWRAGNPAFGFDAKVPIKEIDATLHTEREGADGLKVTFRDRPDRLPNGVFILLDGIPHLLKDLKAYAWSPAGYGMATCASTG